MSGNGQSTPGSSAQRRRAEALHDLGLGMSRAEILAKHDITAERLGVFTQWAKSQLGLTTRRLDPDALRRIGDLADAVSADLDSRARAYDDRLAAAVAHYANSQQNGRRPTLPDVAATFEVGASDLRTAIRSAGQSTRARRYSDEVEAQIIAAYRRGASTVELARAYGCDDRLIGRLLARHGVARRPSNRERAQEVLGADGADFPRVAARYREWVQHSGRSPRSTSTEPIEKFLANWRQRQIRDLDALDESEMSLLLDAIGATPGSRAARLAAFRAKAMEVAAWLDEHGRPPRRSADPYERSLGTWLAVSRARKHRKDMAVVVEQERVLDELLPGWAEVGTFGKRPGHRYGDHDWILTMVQYQNWVRAHGRYPTNHAEDADEVRLAAWMNKVRHRSALTTSTPDRLRAQRETLLDTHLPRWRVGKSKFFQRAHDYHDFVQREGRRPSRRAADPEERSIAVWLHSAQHRYRTPGAQTDDRSREEHIALLDQLVPDWRGPRPPS